MANIDLARRTITLTIVWFGPRQAGCGTNVRQLHRAQPARTKATLHVLGTEERGSRLWHFVAAADDGPDVAGFEVALQVVALPSTSEVALEREQFLDGVDGVVFVADARQGRHEENVSAFLDLQACLARRGLDLGGLPHVFQVNHTDHPTARPARRVLEDLDAHGAPAVEAMARSGRGVLETWDAVRRLVLARLGENGAGARLQLTLTAMSRAIRDAALTDVLDHADVVAPAEPLPDAVSSVRAEEVLLAPDALVGAHPLHVLGAEVRAGRVRTDVVVRRADGSSRRLAFLLDARPTGAEAPVPRRAARPEPIDESTASYRPVRPLGPSLAPTPPSERDLPPWTYGVLGLVAGVTSGFLLSYILG
ncbi:MAG: hypothetical protein RLZZ383_2699 [Pseudomonadota bacterium]